MDIDLEILEFLLHSEMKQTIPVYQRFPYLADALELAPQLEDQTK